MGLTIEDLEKDQKFQDLVLSVFHAAMHTFGATAAAKIIENQLGRAFVKSQIVHQIQAQMVQPPLPPPVAP